MLAWRSTLPGTGCVAQPWRALRVGLAARRESAVCGLWRGTALRGFDYTSRPAHDDGCAGAPRQNWTCASLVTADFGRRGRLIREKIIGHGMHSLAAPAAVHRGLFHHRLLRSEEHTSELQSHVNLVCRLLLEKKKNKN